MCVLLGVVLFTIWHTQRCSAQPRSSFLPVLFDLILVCTHVVYTEIEKERAHGERQCACLLCYRFRIHSAIATQTIYHNVYLCRKFAAHSKSEWSSSRNTFPNSQFCDTILVYPIYSSVLLFLFRAGLITQFRRNYPNNETAKHNYPWVFLI